MTTPGSDYAYQLPERALPDPLSGVPETTAGERQDIPGDRAGRALYMQRAALLPGLGQPAAPAWQDLGESVRRRWRGHAAQDLMTGAGRWDGIGR
jgi:hypothetical protein